MCAFFSNSSKKYLNFRNNVRCSLKMETSCSRMWRWDGLVCYSLLKTIWNSFDPFTKMHDDVPKNNIASENMNLFYDLELILGLHVIFFMLLDFVHALTKQVQSHDVFVYMLLLMCLKWVNFGFTNFILVHKLSLMTQFFMNWMFLSHSLAKICQ